MLYELVILLLCESVRHSSFLKLNSEIYSVNLCTQSKCPKIRRRISPNTDTFYEVYIVLAHLPSPSFSKYGQA